MMVDNVLYRLMEYELYICPVVVGPFRDFGPKIKKKNY